MSTGVTYDLTYLLTSRTLTPCPRGSSLAASTVRVFFYPNNWKFAYDENRTQDLRVKPRGEHSRGFCYPNSRKFAYDENRTQDLLGRDVTELGNPTRPPNLSHLDTS